ncbi:MAG: ComF family protein [Bacillota bacterium]
MDLILDTLFPQKQKCLNCGFAKSSKEITGLCTNCLEGINFLSRYCKICGRQLAKRTNNVCAFCHSVDYYFQQARAVALYRAEMKEIIANFKYRGTKSLIKPLGQLLNLYFAEYYKNVNFAAIIAVPLHNEKKQIRGFNQASLLARELSCYNSLSYLENLIVRSRKTTPFYNLTFRERQEQISGAFKANRYPQNLRDRSVLLIDDIFTTGSTVNEVSKVLLQEVKVGTVHVLTLATAAKIN